MQTCNPAFAQGLHVVAVAFALERRTLAKPTPWRDAGEGHGLPLRAVAAHLEQAVDHAKPVGGGAARTAHKLTGVRIGYFQVLCSAFMLGRCQQCHPRDGMGLGLGGAALALVQGCLGAHAVARL